MLKSLDNKLTRKDLFMKSYFDYMNELSPSDLIDGLLGYGLFAEKIPPVFSSKDFCDHYKKGTKLSPEKPKCDYIRYESMRCICVPRPLSIPNPFAYADLCMSLKSHWEELKSYFSTITSNQKYKNSRIHIRKLKNRDSIFEMNYKNFSSDGNPQDELIRFSRYKVSADISSCFPSIYTHAIPWAVKGKAASKIDTSHWSDELDEKCRNTKYGETSGILIGPHASNVISEIILCRIDEALVNEGFTYFRCIDDYTCYCSSMEEAEYFISSLNKQLKLFELSMNHKKTRITTLPDTSETDWIIRLNSVYFGNTYNADKKQVVPLSILKTYLDIAVRATIEGNDAVPLNYAIKVLSSKYLGTKAKEYYINRLKHLVFSYPYLAPLMNDYVFNPFSVPLPDIIELANAMYKYGFEHDAFEASSYALYWAIVHEVQIDVKAENEVFATKDCVFMLLSFIYSKQNKMGKVILNNYKIEAERLLNSELDRYWLFVYEVIPQTKLKGSYKNLKRNKISFIKKEIRDLM